MSEGAKIYKAITLVMQDLEAIGKDRRNQQQGFQYRGIDDVYNEIHEPLSKHGVFTMPTVLESMRTQVPSKLGGTLNFTVLKVQYRFYAEDGSYVDAIVQGEGMDSGDKSSNKAMAAAHKYALLQVFAVPTEDAKDPDAESPQMGGPADSAPAQRQESGTPVRTVARVQAKTNAGPKPKSDARKEPPMTKEREDLNKLLMQLYKPFKIAAPEFNLLEFLQSRYQVAETRLMTVEQVQDLIRFMQGRIAEDRGNVA